MDRSLTLWLRRFGASVGFVGYFPWASGTLVSAITTVAIWFAHTKYPEFFTIGHAVYFWGAIVLVCGLSMLVSSHGKETFGLQDAPQIVIDEVAGQFITFFLIPISLPTLLLGFLLFRFYDIVKPFPVHHMEDMDEGVGVTMDDVAAGVLANISLILIMTSYHYIRSHL